MCFVRKACTAFSVRTSRNDALVCRLARENVYVNSPDDVPWALYFVE
jgi:hypothetical protein